MDKKLSNALIGNTENLDLVMPMYSLLEYNHNQSMTSRSVWNYFRDEIDGVDENVLDGNYSSVRKKRKIISTTTTTSTTTTKSR